MTISRNAFLTVRNATRRFGTHAALSDVSLEIHAGELVCLLGPSGCGKTTLLRVIAGLERQDAGTIHLAGRDISHAPPQSRNYGILFQSYALFPNLTVSQNVAYGLTSRRRLSEQVRARVTEMLELVGLAGAEDKYPGQLSGGQQQRVALARALAPSPSLLLLDEPMSALDARVREHLRIELRALQKQLSITTLMVTHDQEEAMVMADRVAVMERGAIVQFDTPQALYRQPANGFVADFIGESNWLRYQRLDAHSAQVGNATLAVRDALPQDAGRLFLRPEHVQITTGRPDDSQRQGENWLLADVLDGVFLGRHYRLSLRVDGIADSPLNAVVPAELGDALLRPNGARRCWAALPAARLHAYP